MHENQYTVLSGGGYFKVETENSVYNVFVNSDELPDVDFSDKNGFDYLTFEFDVRIIIDFQKFNDSKQLEGFVIKRIKLKDLTNIDIIRIV